MNLGIILPNWIGDVAMATPMLRAVRKQFPRPARLVGLLRPYVADVLAGTPWLDELIYYRAGTGEAAHSTLGAARELRRRRLDAVILLSNSFRTAAIAGLSGAGRRLGYVRHGRAMLLTDPLYPPQNGRARIPVSAVDYYLELAYYLGCPTESRRLELATLPEDERGADQIWQRHGFSSSRRVVMLNTGGASGAKRWPAEHAAILARRVAVELDSGVLVMCGPTERAAANQVARLANHPRVKSMADEAIGVGLSKACTRRAAAMVTTDSGPRHFAAAFDVPTVTLYGPNDAAWSVNYNPRAVDLRLSLPCRPCGKKTCPLQHHRCMNDLTPDVVFNALERVLSKNRPQRRVDADPWRPRPQGQEDRVRSPAAECLV
jgi:heptosyltransferase-2